MSLYESDDDRKNQRGVADILESRYGIKLHDAGRLSQFDFVIYKGPNIVCLVEIKCRGAEYTSGRIDELGGYMVDVGKIMLAARWHLLGISYLLAVRLADGVFVFSVKASQPWPKSFSVGWGGRSDRGDAADSDLCCFIPMADFKRIA